ncbi:MAG TPA: type 1 glutamine amidotransferase [bacterium]|nr:type 1 glutamine amidotransferase [bacterium]
MATSVLIINPYPRESREVLDRAGMRAAEEIYVRVLRTLAPEIRGESLFIADLKAPLPTEEEIAAYGGVIWTGSNLTIYEDDPRVTRQIEFARRVFEVGRPQFGSCWGVQMAAVAAGGEVRRNPRGREMGFARKIHLTPEGRRHPMYEGKPDVFDAFISHLDEVTELPPGAVLLATNAHTPVQALEVRYRNGTFWATQYHPEYHLEDMARLITARAESLIREGFFADRATLEAKVGRMDALVRDPLRKDLQWDLAVEDDILEDDLRQSEFRNWLRKAVLPSVPVARG